MSDSLSVIISVCQCSFCNFFSVSYSSTIFLPYPCRAQLFILYYYSFSIHFRSHLICITHVSIGSLSLLDLFLFTLTLFPYLVPFLFPKGTTFSFTLCLFLYLVSFCAQNLFQKRHNPYSSRTPPCALFIFTFSL